MTAISLPSINSVAIKNTTPYTVLTHFSSKSYMAKLSYPVKSKEMGWSM